jgi:hypothetical protein
LYRFKSGDDVRTLRLSIPRIDVFFQLDSGELGRYHVFLQHEEFKGVDPAGVVLVALIYSRLCLCAKYDAGFLDDAIDLFWFHSLLIAAH